MQQFIKSSEQDDLTDVGIDYNCTITITQT